MCSNSINKFFGAHQTHIVSGLCNILHRDITIPPSTLQLVNVCHYTVLLLIIATVVTNNSHSTFSPQLNNMYKIGLLYCKDGQHLEEEMYNNGEYVCTCVFDQPVH